MKVSDLMDKIMLRLAMMKDSTGWNTQRIVVLGMLETITALMDKEFRDRLRFVPNVILEPSQRGNYHDGETITTYKLPDDVDPFRIDSLSTLWSGIWHTVPRGISQNMRDNAYAATPTYSAWDIIQGGEVEVWPHPTTMHTVRISYHRRPADYTSEDQCVDMDAQLLLLMTLNTAIPFYGRPDGESNNAMLNKHLGNIKSDQIGGQRFHKAPVAPRAGTPDHADQIYSWPIHGPAR